MCDMITKTRQLFTLDQHNEDANNYMLATYTKQIAYIVRYSMHL